MPKRYKDIRRHAPRGGAFPLWAPRHRSISYRLREAREQVVGTPFDREPCPHTLTTWDTIPDLTKPDDPFRTRSRRTLTPCVRPAAHVRQQRVVSVPDPQHPQDPHRFATLTVPDESARLHADATGRTW